MHPYINIATKAALLASKAILRYFGQLDQVKIIEKQENVFVSEVDLYAERVIIDTIQKAYPRHSIISEESGCINGESDTTWIIDPLDGTSNYLHNVPHFAVSIAVKKNDRIEHGVIYDPIRKELFSASIGQGARLNNHKIRVSKQVHLNRALLGTCFAFRNNEMSKRYFTTFETLFTRCSGFRRCGSYALDLAYVAAGRYDGFWDTSLQLWDIAAGILLVREAGGLVSDFHGSENYLKTGNIVAANPKIFKSLLQHIRPAVMKDDHTK